MYKTYCRRPVAGIHFPHATVLDPWEMPDLCRAYNFPTGIQGPTQVIGIIELGGGYRMSDIQTAFSKWGLAAPQVVDVSVAGGSNRPGGAADGEVVLDLEIAAAAYTYCTGKAATIRMYFAPNTDAGFAAAVARAIADGCSTISISWGGPEASWGPSAIGNMDMICAQAAAAGCTVFAASGDNNSSDGLSGTHVDFPASSPHVIGVGGTYKPHTGQEIVWNDGPREGTGGGYSVVFAPQAWQIGAPSAPGRTVPDIAALASPAPGYNVFLDGAWGAIGGTSAGAPLMAGLFAAFNCAFQGQNLPRLGFLADRLYRHPASFWDIIAGSNGQWNAKAGVDMCTGLGVVNGAAMLQQLLGSVPLPPPVQPPPTQPPPGTNPPPAPLPTMDKYEYTADVILHLGGHKVSTPAKSSDKHSWS